MLNDVFTIFRARPGNTLTPSSSATATTGTEETIDTEVVTATETTTSTTSTDRANPDTTTLCSQEWQDPNITEYVLHSHVLGILLNKMTSCPSLFFPTGHSGTAPPL